MFIVSSVTGPPIDLSHSTNASIDTRVYLTSSEYSEGKIYMLHINRILIGHDTAIRNPKKHK